jgi:Ca2+-binding EF-hand superfamily protein
MFTHLALVFLLLRVHVSAVDPRSLDGKTHISFNVIDTDHNNKLDSQELNNALRELGSPLTPEELQSFHFPMNYETFQSLLMSEKKRAPEEKLPKEEGEEEEKINLDS